MATALVVVGTAAVVVANREDLPAAWDVVRHVHPVWLLVAVGLVAVGFVDLAVEHAAAQRAVGFDPGLRSIASPAWAARFLNLVTKSGGVAGVAAFSRVARQRGWPEGAVVGGYLLATVLDVLAFAVVLAVALAALVADGRLSAPDAVLAAIFAAYLAVTGVGVALALRSPNALRLLYALPSQVGRRLQRRRSSPGQPDHHGADELCQAVAVLRHRAGSAWAPALAAVGVDLIAVAQLWAVLGAAGTRPGFVVPLVAYSVSTLVGIVGVVPGGVGFVEVSLGAMLVSSGVPAGAAGAAVVLYRVVEFWIPLGVGAAATRLVVRSPSLRP